MEYDPCVTRRVLLGNPVHLRASDQASYSCVLVKAWSYSFNYIENSIKLILYMVPKARNKMAPALLKLIISCSNLKVAINSKVS